MTERVTSGLRRRGAGDGFTVRLVRHRQTKETETDRHHLRDTAPVLDPTVILFDSVTLATVEFKHSHRSSAYAPLTSCSAPCSSAASSNSTLKH
jgi:hypothetical protein